MAGKGRLSLGLMRLKDISVEDLAKTLLASYELGVRELDIADVYVGGVAETKLGAVFAANPGFRDKVFLQSKAGIVKGADHDYYDFSRTHLLEAVDASLKRLQTDHLDSLLLHRPDVFADANEVGEALNELHRSGKVRHFGVSNFPVAMIEYLESGMGGLKFETAQYQLGLGQAALFADVINENNVNPAGGSLDSGLLFFLKRHNIDLEAWSPLQIGLFKGNVLTDPAYAKTQAKPRELAAKTPVTPGWNATSFVPTPCNTLRALTGSLNLGHIKEALAGTEIKLDKADWYALYETTGNLLP